MSSHSDLVINASQFNEKDTPKETAELNDALVHIMEKGPKWYEVGAQKYREMRWKGETSFPKPAVLPEGQDATIPSRDQGREIPCRVFKPSKGDVKGVFMHIHGGGWVLQSEHFQDSLLKFMADECNLAVVSVGYRLAPEYPFPAGPNDCYDAAEYLIKNGKERFGGDLLFAGGESAGAHLSVLVALYLLDNKRDFAFKGLVLHFGCYDLAGMVPSAHNFPRQLILDLGVMNKYLDAFLPNTTEAQRRDPKISPIFADLKKYGWGKLPPALFTCGTQDPLLDDSVFMAAKWQTTGAEGILKVWPGAPHGFISFPKEAMPSAAEALAETKKFILGKIS